MQKLGLKSQRAPMTYANLSQISFNDADVVEIDVASKMSQDSTCGREDSSPTNDVEVDIIPEVQSRNMRKVIDSLERTAGPQRKSLYDSQAN